VQQLSGGLASVVAGHIVTLGADGKLQHFDTIGYVVVGTSLAAFVLLWQLQRGLGNRLSPQSATGLIAEPPTDKSGS